MSRILVIGGYGGFGARLSRRLAAAGHRLIVAGRREAEAVRFCAALPAAEPLAMNRAGNIGAVLARCRPDLVIDAAGPFQGSSYQVAEACIVAGIHYLDLADSRGFVTGIVALDHAARRRGVAAIAGASTSPALTGAVARALASGLDRVDSVEIALSAANRARGGDSVLAAVLSYVGRRLRVWRGGRWTHGWGWQEIRREDFLLADGTGLRGRLVALADLPDCETLPAQLPGRPAVSFRAGTELRFQMVALWLASWPVRWGLTKPLAGAARWLAPLYRLTGRIGGLRSAMAVTLAGRAGKRRVERRWTIVAERGDGLEIPTLTAELLAADILAGRCAAGAYHAASLLSLDRYELAFAELSVRHETSERELPPALYARLLGPAWKALPAAVRSLHDVCRDSGAVGEGTVVRGTSLAARMIGAAMRFPPGGTWPLHVGFSERGGVETWTRDFGGHRFASELSSSSGLLVERFGPLRFAFDPPATCGGLEMRLCRWSAFRIPLPLALAPRIRAREWEEGGRFRFEVRVALPVIGDVVGYSGWLERLEGGEVRPAAAQAAA
jgi:hypothetical protein